MFRFRSFHLLSIAAAMLAVTATLPVRAENPMERLHKKLFGDDDKKDDKDKKKKKDHDHDDHRNDDRRSYQQAPVIERRVYVEPAPRYVEPRYVDPAPRPYYEQRRETYIEPTRRPYYESRREIYIEPAPRTSYAGRPVEVDVQLALRRNGYYAGPIDGDLGPGTRAAIRDYQYDRRLPVTGRIDTYLLRSLGL